MILLGICLIACAFFTGFLVCFVCFTDKSLKAQYSNSLKRLDAAEDKTRWRNYAKEKPAKNQFCIIVDPNDQVNFGTYNADGDAWQDKGFDGEVVYWLPFPEVRV